MKPYLIIIIFTLFLQIFISFYTTNRLVIYSQVYQSNFAKFNQLKKTNQQLQNQHSRLTSKTYLKQEINKLNLYPVQKTLDLNQ
jgi:hypothetical protein